MEGKCNEQVKGPIATNRNNEVIEIQLRYPYPADQNFNRIISDISSVPRETTLIISEFIQTGSQVETESRN